MDAKVEKATPERQNSLAYAENIIATLREPFVVLDKSLRVRTANGAFYRDFHVSREGTEGPLRLRNWAAVEWNIPQLRALLSQVLSNTHPVEDFEVDHAFPNLGCRNMLLNARRFPPESEDPNLVLLAIEDVTDRRLAERLVRESELRFRRLLDNLPAAAYTCDAEGLITYFNRGAAELWGREPKLNDPTDRFCGSFKMFSADGAPLSHNECWMAQTLRDGKAYNQVEVVVERSDGSRRIGLAHVNPSFDAAGRLSGAVNVVVDITERRRRVDALNISEIRYRRLFEMAKDGILILDAGTGRVIDANPFMTGLLGYSHEEFLGKELWEIGLFRDITENQAAYRELQDKGYVRYEHLPLESRSGEKIEVEFVSNVYEENQHQVVQCNIRDITERRRLEQLTQDQAAVLADLDRRKDQFLAMLSHELRNPLAPILNASLLLRLHSNRNRLQGIENPVVHQSAMIIERQVGQLAKIVDELLEVSRITTGRIQLHQERIALGVVVENALATVRSFIDERKHKLSVSVPAEPIWASADAARLEQVVVNLLTNAAKYTDPGGRVWLALQQEGEEGGVRASKPVLGNGLRRGVQRHATNVRRSARSSRTTGTWWTAPSRVETAQKLAAR